jgi:hypothetical protein
MQPSLLCCIDPGAAGGYVLRRPSGELAEVGAYAEPRDVLKLCTFLRANNLSVFPIVAVIERVWASPVMGVSAAFAFGGNYFGWVMALKASGIPVLAVTPQQWQKVAAPQISEQGADRKRALRALAAERFPDLKVTLATADALLISEYALAQLRVSKPLGEPL